MVYVRWWTEMHPDNIYLAILVVDYATAASSDQKELLQQVMTSLSDKDGLHETADVPSFISLDILSPYEADGKVHYGGMIEVDEG